MRKQTHIFIPLLAIILYTFISCTSGSQVNPSIVWHLDPLPEYAPIYYENNNTFYQGFSFKPVNQTAWVLDYFPATFAYGNQTTLTFNLTFIPVLNESLWDGIQLGEIQLIGFNPHSLHDIVCILGLDAQPLGTMPQVDEYNNYTTLADYNVSLIYTPFNGTNILVEEGGRPVRWVAFITYWCITTSPLDTGYVKYATTTPLFYQNITFSYDTPPKTNTTPTTPPRNDIDGFPPIPFILIGTGAIILTIVAKKRKLKV